MRQTKIEIALPAITAYFDNLPEKIFKLKELTGHFTNNRENWGLAQATTSKKFIEFLIENGKLKRSDFPFPYRHETRFYWGDIPLYELLLTLQKNCYFSHHSAMYLNELTNGIPKTIYLNHEQPARAQSGLLAQKSIDAAFRNKPRISNNAITYDELNICMINGMNTNQRGVISKTVTHMQKKCNVRLTDIERTLIDITVRPIYSGGIDAVKLAYSLAKDRVSVKALRDMYIKLKYQYPFHQAIGYYLETANYPTSLVNLFQEMPIEFDFYLTNQMKETSYIEKWKLFVPIL
jgi:predicted transcriptional regulator of viral defense system